MSELGLMAAKTISLANPGEAQVLADELRNAVTAANSAADELFSLGSSVGYCEEDMRELAESIMLSVDHVLSLASAMSDAGASRPFDRNVRSEMPTLPVDLESPRPLERIKLSSGATVSVPVYNRQKGDDKA